VVGWRTGALDAKVQDGPREWIEDCILCAQMRSRLRSCDDGRNTVDEHGCCGHLRQGGGWIERGGYARGDLQRILSTMLTAAWMLPNGA
jgi:hypothetical protein